jgi:hypothetical protein
MTNEEPIPLFMSDELIEQYVAIKAQRLTSMPDVYGTQVETDSHFHLTLLV